MNFRYLKQFFPLFIFILIGCGSNKDGKTGLDSPDSDEQSNASGENASIINKDEIICLWKELSIREQAGDKAKWLTNVTMGEKMQYAGEIQSVESGGKQVEFLKIVLVDGTEGWVRKDFVAQGASRAVCVSNCKIYKRPDILTASDKNLEPMDFVAVLSINEDWCEIKTKRNQDSWFVSGYVKKDNLSFTDADISLSFLMRKANAIENVDLRVKELKDIETNYGDFNSSVFWPELSKSISDNARIAITVDAFTPSRVTLVDQKTFNTEGAWKQVWEKQVKSSLCFSTPCEFKDIKPGVYTLIAIPSNDSAAVHIRSLILDKNNDGEGIYISKEEFNN